ncbi:MAG: sensor histidine kinase [Chloroflexi bacterium]|nr:MAG: sensor histidine kinase [Chloroflexota bacterium]
MSNVTLTNKRRILQTIILFLPLIGLVVLRLMPAWDLPAWGISWFTRLVHYYIVSFASFVALITALFFSSFPNAQKSARAVFITLAFSTISALLLLSGLSTPNILIMGATNEIFRWSLRLSVPVGAIIFTLSAVSWPKHIETKIITQRHKIFLVALGLFSGYTLIVFLQPGWLTTIAQSSFDSVLKYTLAITSVLLLVWTTWRNYNYYQQSRLPVDRNITLSLILLAQAEICHILGVWGRLSWLLFLPATATAIILAFFAILKQLRESDALQPSRYFAALGSSIIVALSLVVGEVGMRWLTNGVNRTSVVSLALVQGGIGFLVLYIIVIKQEKLVQERTAAWRQEQHWRNELTQLIVHDLKSPLTVLASGIRLLQGNYLGELTWKQEELLQEMNTISQDIIRQIEDLLNLERMEAGSMTLDLQSVDVAELIRSRMKRVEIQAQEQQQALAVMFSDDLPPVWADKDLLGRTLDNLLANALKFTPEGGEITVSADVEDNKWLVISVTDTGPGIPESDRERVFEKFGQVSGRKRKGAGLGLAFCRMAVMAHAGSIEVAERRGGGSVFRVKLPLQLKQRLQQTAVSLSTPSLPAELKTSLSD